MLVALLYQGAADALDTFPHLGIAGVQGRYAQADAVGLAKIGNESQLLDQGAIDAVAFRMADADMLATLHGIARGAQGKTKRGQDVVE